MAKGTESFRLVTCEDGKRRPEWAASDPMLMEYFDNEWGVAVHSERGVFERLVLESFQSGLSWATILKKRPAFRRAFRDFDPEKVARFGPADISRLMENPAIIRNRRKIDAAIANAKATLALRDDGGLADLVWSYAPKERVIAKGSVKVPAQIPESVALAADLKRRGFVWVGPVTVCAMMLALGVVDVRGESGVF